MLNTKFHTIQDLTSFHKLLGYQERLDLLNHVLLLDDVLYVPNAFKNIISISSLTRRGYEFLFSRDVCKLYFGNKMIGMGYVIHGLYHVDNMINNIEPQ